MPNKFFCFLLNFFSKSKLNTLKSEKPFSIAKFDNSIPIFSHFLSKALRKNPKPQPKSIIRGFLELVFFFINLISSLRSFIFFSLSLRRFLIFPSGSLKALKLRVLWLKK